MDWEGTIQVISVPSFVGFKPYSYRFMYNTRYRIQDTNKIQDIGYRIQTKYKIRDIKDNRIQIKYKIRIQNTVAYRVQDTE